MVTEDKDEARWRVQSVDRAVILLDALAAAPEPQSAPNLADACGLNRSTAWRLLSTLEHHGLIDRDSETNRYYIGIGILRLAGAAGHQPLVRGSHPKLRQLAQLSGESVDLAVASGLRLVIADQVASNHVFEMNWVGRSIPLHATSIGKAFLAALPEDQVDAAIVAPLPPLTENTTTDLATLKHELAQVRTAGYAESRGEFELMLWSVAAAVYDDRERPIGVVSVWGAEQRMKDRVEELGLACVATAREITAMLGSDKRAAIG